MGIKEKIITTSRKKFFLSGFQKTTMDEIADELKVSKKTIYKFFSSKEDLVIAVAGQMQDYIAERVNILISEDSSAVDKIYKFTQILSELSLQIDNQMLDDLRLYLPKVWQKIDDFRDKLLYKNFKVIFDQGKKEGLVKENDNEIILRVWISSIQGVINPDFILNHHYSMKSALDELITILMNGILTSKGSRQLLKVKRNK